jgi:hypothetical protein
MVPLKGPIRYWAVFPRRAMGGTVKDRWLPIKVLFFMFLIVGTLGWAALRFLGEPS